MAVRPTGSASINRAAALREQAASKKAKGARKSAAAAKVLEPVGRKDFKRGMKAVRKLNKVAEHSGMPSEYQKVAKKRVAKKPGRRLV